MVDRIQRKIRDQTILYLSKNPCYDFSIAESCEFEGILVKVEGILEGVSRNPKVLPGQIHLLCLHTIAPESQ